jgi:hypothetical protein
LHSTTTTPGAGLPFLLNSGINLTAEFVTAVRLGKPQTEQRLRNVRPKIGVAFSLVLDINRDAARLRPSVKFIRDNCKLGETNE